MAHNDIAIALQPRVSCYCYYDLDIVRPNKTRRFPRRSCGVGPHTILGVDVMELILTTRDRCDHGAGSVEQWTTEGEHDWSDAPVQLLARRARSPLPLVVPPPRHPFLLFTPPPSPVVPPPAPTPPISATLQRRGGGGFVGWTR